MKRLAYICADSGVPVFGNKGCSVHVQEVIRGLRSLGVLVELFATRLGGEAPRDLAELTVHPLPATPKGELAIREAAAWRANTDLRLQLERLGPFDALYERYSLWSVAGMEYARAQGIPGLLEVNAPLIEEQAAHRGLVNLQAARAATAQSFANASVLLAVSEEVAAYVGRLAGHERVHVLPNGVNVERFADAREKRHSRIDPRLTVGFVGTLKPWHGTEVLLRAFAAVVAAVPSSRLLIVGDGPERTALQHLACALALQTRVTFTGSVAPETVPDYLAEMDVAVAPYPRLDDFYFSPLKVYEYMAADLPVIASDIGQLRRVITHDHDGWLIEAGNSRQLTEALLGLLRDRMHRERLGKAAQQTVARHHTWRAVAERILALTNSHPGHSQLQPSKSLA